jgi:hypothetical protein
MNWLSTAVQLANVGTARVAVFGLLAAFSLLKKPPQPITEAWE